MWITVREKGMGIIEIKSNEWGRSGCKKDLGLLVDAAARLGDVVIGLAATASCTNGADSLADLLLEADIVISELAHLSIIDTKDFGLLRSAKTKTRDEVHDPENDGL